SRLTRPSSWLEGHGCTPRTRDPDKDGVSSRDGNLRSKRTREDEIARLQRPAGPDQSSGEPAHGGERMAAAGDAGTACGQLSMLFARHAAEQQIEVGGPVRLGAEDEAAGRGVVRDGIDETDVPAGDP